MGKAAARPEPRAARSPVVVRQARAADAERISELRRQAERYHERLNPDYFRESPRSAPEVARSGTGFVTLVAEAAPPRVTGTGPMPIVGYATLRIVDTPRDPALVPRRRAHVETVVVDERHRRRGVGTALMRALADWAQRREAAEVVLTVWSRNAAALALYRRLRYQPVAQVLRLEITP